MVEQFTSTPGSLVPVCGRAHVHPAERRSCLLWSLVLTTGGYHHPHFPLELPSFLSKQGPGELSRSRSCDPCHVEWGHDVDVSCSTSSSFLESGRKPAAPRGRTLGPCAIANALLTAVFPLFLFQSSRTREVHQVSIWATPLLPSSGTSVLCPAGVPQQPALLPARPHHVHSGRQGWLLPEVLPRRVSRPVQASPDPASTAGAPPLPSSVLSPRSWPAPARTLGMTLPPPRLFQGTEVRDSEVRRRPATRGEASVSLAGTRSRLQQGACGSVRAPLSPTGIHNSLQGLLCLVHEHSPRPKCPSPARDVSVLL